MLSSLLGIVGAMASGGGLQTDADNCIVISDFSAGNGRAWRSVNDGVMGGLSTGGSKVVSERLLFSGTINTDGGGFSSIRTGIKPGSLAGMTELRLVVQGDGRTYGMIFQTDERFRGRPVTYRQEFETTAGDDEQTIVVPVSRFVPSVFGRNVRAAPLDVSAISEAGIILADGQDGDFDLRIKSVKACIEAE